VKYCRPGGAEPRSGHHDGPHHGVCRRDGCEGLGPSLGGVLIAGFGWRTIFHVNVPLGVLNFLLAHRYLPVDRRGPKTDRASFDNVGTLLLALNSRPDQRGVISGMLSLSRNLELITGASFMGAVFALASRPSTSQRRVPRPLPPGMWITFAVAATLIVVALAIAVGTYRRTLRNPTLASEEELQATESFGMTSRRVNSLGLDLQGPSSCLGKNCGSLRFASLRSG
jgi:hypothetical protein